MNPIRDCHRHPLLMELSAGLPPDRRPQLGLQMVRADGLAAKTLPLLLFAAVIILLTTPAK
jgi:hypothetical protein